MYNGGMAYVDGWDCGRGRAFRGRGCGYGAQPVRYDDNGEYDAPPAPRGKLASPSNSGFWI